MATAGGRRLPPRRRRQQQHHHHRRYTLLLGIVLLVLLPTTAADRDAAPWCHALHQPLLAAPLTCTATAAAANGTTRRVPATTTAFSPATATLPWWPVDPPVEPAPPQPQPPPPLDGDVADVDDDNGDADSEEAATTDVAAPAATVPPLPSFDQWRQQVVATDGRVQAAAQFSQRRGERRRQRGGRTAGRFNYAAGDCGAKVLESNREAVGASAVLTDDPDRYVLNPCQARGKYLVVEMCDTILIDTIALANLELFSSSPRRVRVAVSDAYPTAAWRPLATLDMANQRALQTFGVADPVGWARYLRIDFDEHYGHEYFCPLTFLRVYGVTMMQDYQDDLADLVERFAAGTSGVGGAASSASGAAGGDAGDDGVLDGDANGLVRPAAALDASAPAGGEDGGRLQWLRRLRRAVQQTLVDWLGGVLPLPWAPSPEPTAEAADAGRAPFVYATAPPAPPPPAKPRPTTPEPAKADPRPPPTSSASGAANAYGAHHVRADVPPPSLRQPLRTRGGRWASTAAAAAAAAATGTGGARRNGTDVCAWETTSAGAAARGATGGEAARLLRCPLPPDGWRGRVAEVIGGSSDVVLLNHEHGGAAAEGDGDLPFHVNAGDILQLLKGRSPEQFDEATSIYTILFARLLELEMNATLTSRYTEAQSARLRNGTTGRGGRQSAPRGRRTDDGSGLRRDIGEFGASQRWSSSSTRCTTICWRWPKTSKPWRMQSSIRYKAVRCEEVRRTLGLTLLSLRAASYRCRSGGRLRWSSCTWRPRWPPSRRSCAFRRPTPTDARIALSSW